jgi:hypothetical protein
MKVGTIGIGLAGARLNPYAHAERWAGAPTKVLCWSKLSSHAAKLLLELKLGIVMSSRLTLTRHSSEVQKVADKKGEARRGIFGACQRRKCVKVTKRMVLFAVAGYQAGGDPQAN